MVEVHGDDDVHGEVEDVGHDGDDPDEKVEIGVVLLRRQSINRINGLLDKKQGVFFLAGRVENYGRIVGIFAQYFALPAVPLFGIEDDPRHGRFSGRTLFRHFFAARVLGTFVKRDSRKLLEGTGELLMLWVVMHYRRNDLGFPGMFA